MRRVDKAPWFLINWSMAVTSDYMASEELVNLFIPNASAMRQVQMKDYFSYLFNVPLSVFPLADLTAAI